MLQLDQIGRPFRYLLQFRNQIKLKSFSPVRRIRSTYRIIKWDVQFVQQWYSDISSPRRRITRSAQKYFRCWCGIGQIQFWFRCRSCRRWCLRSQPIVLACDCCRWWALSSESLQIGSQYTKFTECESVHLARRDVRIACFETTASASGKQFCCLQHFINCHGKWGGPFIIWISYFIDRNAQRRIWIYLLCFSVGLNFNSSKSSWSLSAGTMLHRALARHTCNASLHEENGREKMGND